MIAKIIQRTKHLSARWKPYVLLFLLTSLAVQPFWVGFPVSTDGKLHLVRLAEVLHLLRSGLFFSRLAPDLGYGFGIPLFNYYAPLSYYLTLPWHLAGAGLALSVALSMQLATFVAAAGVFCWLRDRFSAPAAFVAAVSYIYAPYYLFNLLHRSALPEVWGLAFLPWAAWAGEKALRRGQRRYFWLGWLFLAALILTHNVTALLGVTFLFLLLLPAAMSHGPQRAAARLSLLFGVPLLWTTFFWLPALAEKKYVRIYELYLPAVFDFRHNFSTLRQLLALPHPADLRLVRPDIPVSLSWPQWLLALPALWRIFFPHARNRRYTLWLFLLALLAIVMVTPLSGWIWAHLPLLRFLQFPWRFLGIADLFLAALLAGSLSLWSRLTWRWAVGLGFVPVLVGLFWLFPALQPWPRDLSAADVIRFEAETGAVGTTWTGEYTPVTVPHLPPPETLLPLYRQFGPDPIPRLRRIDGVQVTAAQYGLLDAHLDVHSAQGGTLTFAWFYFPGWQTVPTLPVTPDANGLLQVGIPPGHHHFHLYFGPTRLRRGADFVSLFSLLLAIGGLFLVRRRKGTVAQTTMPPPDHLPGTKLLIVTFVLMAAFWVGKSAYLDSHNSLLRHSRFNGIRVAGVEYPRAVSFSGKMRLLGFDLPRRAAISLFDVTLYWQTLRPLAVDYSVSLSLVDQWGRRYGQADSQNPDNYPTSRWRLDQYGIDRHRLSVDLGAPPGEYRLLLTVYDARTGGALSWLDQNGAPAGTDYPVATVHVLARTGHWPAPGWHPQRGLRCSANGLTLVGIDLPVRQVQTGDRLPVNLYWQAAAAPLPDQCVRLQLVNGRGEVVAQQERIPGRPDLPTDRWPSSAHVLDKAHCLVPATLPAGDYTLRLAFAQGTDVAPCPLGTVQVIAPTHRWRQPSARHQTNVRVDGLAALRGYDVETDITDGQVHYAVTLYWQVTQTPGVAYKGFVHLLNPQGKVIGQQDQTPAAGLRPTTGWVPGEFIVDRYQFSAPEREATGGKLEIGLYNPATGRRLIWHDASCRKDLGDHLLLAP